MNERLGAPWCWICGRVVKPGKVYGPLRCVECLRKKEVFDRAIANRTMVFEKEEKDGNEEESV